MGFGIVLSIRDNSKNELVINYVYACHSMLSNF